MKRYLFVALVFGLLGRVGSIRAQNLVVNGSFEEYTECPPSFGYWANVVGWTSPYTQSADYFNACAENVACSVPFNDFGFQEAAHGQAYMGIFTWVTSFGGYYREVIASQLAQPLQPGVPVHVSFKASPGGFGYNPNNSATWAAKGPGIEFFTALPSDWQDYLFPNSASVDMPTVLSDTSAWATISGLYVPDSAYSWFAITNYFENALSLLEPMDAMGMSDGAYAFVDDVCISYDLNYCSGWNTALEDGEPVTGFAGVLTDGELILHVKGGSDDAQLVLSDLSGRALWEGRYPSGATVMSFEMPQLVASLYFLTMHPVQGSTRTLRLVHFIRP